MSPQLPPGGLPPLPSQLSTPLSPDSPGLPPQTPRTALPAGIAPPPPSLPGEAAGRAEARLPVPQGRAQDLQGLAGALDRLGADQVGADVADMMALLQQMAQDQRAQAKLDIEQRRQDSLDAMLSAADALRAAAEERFRTAVVSGVMQIVGGAASIALGAGGAIKSGVAGQRIDAPGAAGPKDTQALQAQAKVVQGGAQQAEDIMQQMMGIIQDVRDKLAAIEQSQQEVNRGIARNV
ncbi:type III secretion system translocon subunit SctB [Orrella sp. JC864]|uniref:type III secretion system translocon subunit SctB n=1 Tax=Orrella sp. JC864 TaxID=3120298 RepID=UPI0012BC93B4